MMQATMVAAPLSAMPRHAHGFEVSKENGAFPLDGKSVLIRCGKMQSAGAKGVNPISR